MLIDSAIYSSQSDLLEPGSASTLVGIISSTFSSKTVPMTWSREKPDESICWKTCKIVITVTIVTRRYWALLSKTWSRYDALCGMLSAVILHCASPFRCLDHSLARFTESISFGGGERYESTTITTVHYISTQVATVASSAALRSRT